MSKTRLKKRSQGAKLRSAGALVIEPATESNMPANMELILEEEGELLEPSEVLPAQHELESADLASHSEGYARLQDEHAATDAVVPYSALNAYLAELRRFSPLSREDEHAAALEYYATKNKDAAYTLVSGSLWLVVKIAREYERVARNVLDLIQEGNIGLLEAVQNFDPYRGVRFPSYAVWWIRAYIIRYMIANWRLVKIGTTQAQRKLFFNLKKESDRLEREGIYPSSRLLAEKLNVRESDVIEMSQRLGSPDASVDAPLHEDSDSTLLSIIASGGESIEESLSKRQLHEALTGSILEFEKGLTDKERTIFRGRVVNEEILTLQQLSDQLALSKERVRQIENKLRDKLKLFVSKQLGAELKEWIEVDKEGAK